LCKTFGLFLQFPSITIHLPGVLMGSPCVV
jgi:hypothetical protein